MSAVRLSNRLFRDLVDQRTVAAADAWLARTDTPPGPNIARAPGFNRCPSG